MMVLDGSGCVISHPSPGTPPDAASLCRPSWPLHSQDSVSSRLKRLSGKSGGFDYVSFIRFFLMSAV